MILDIVMILLGVLLTVGTFLFVSAEFSLVALDRAVVERRAAEGDRSAAQVLRATRTLSTQLSGAQVGITLTTILLGWTTQTTVAKLISAGLDNVGLTTAVAATAGVTMAAIIVNVCSMLFGELVPKNLALAHPMRTATTVAPFQMAFTFVLRPLICVLNAVSNKLLSLFGVEPQEEISAARSASELAALVRHSAREGTLDTSTAALLTKSIRLGELTAVDVMTDRGLVHSLPEDASARDVVERARETGHSRFPVIGEDSDDVLGIVSLRRAIGVPFDRRAEVPVISHSLMAPAPRVPETLELAPLMIQLRDGGVQMAVVVDEYGGVSGIVTLEDVVEEVVGEVSDEHDQRRLGIRTRPDGRLLVPGTLRPDELLERTGVALPSDGPWDTLAGLIMTELGRVPTVGDAIEVAGVGLEVTQIQGRRVTQIALQRPTATSEDDTRSRRRQR